jgi:hypothetical protein
MESAKSLIARCPAFIGVQLLAYAVGAMSCTEHTRAGRNGSPSMRGEGGASSATAVPSGARAGVMAGSAGGAPEESRLDLQIGRGDVGAVASGDPATRQADAGAVDGGRAVVLTAVVMSAARNGAFGIAAEWVNHTEEAIFLQGCSTVEGWFLKDGQWERYGAFALCAAETQAVEVSPGQTYVDVSGAAASPPNRGANVWRLVGKYGVGCRRGALLGASQCREIREATSVNHIAWAP